MVDDSYDDDADDSEEGYLGDVERHEDEAAQWVCQLGKDCLVASPFHHRDECFDADMARDMFGDSTEDPAPGIPAGDTAVVSPPPLEDDLSFS